MSVNRIRDEQIRITNLPEGRLTNVSGTVGAIKDNLAAVAAPTGGDDFGSGYAVGSLWIYSGKTYICTGGGVWREVASAGEVAPWGTPSSWGYLQKRNSSGQLVNSLISEDSSRAVIEGGLRLWDSSVSKYSDLWVGTDGIRNDSSPAGTHYWWNSTDSHWTGALAGDTTYGTEFHLRDFKPGRPNNFILFWKGNSPIGYLGYRNLDSENMILYSDRVRIETGDYCWLNVGTDLYITCTGLSFFNAGPAAQASPIANATDAASTQSAVNAVLTALRSYGLIAT